MLTRLGLRNFKAFGDEMQYAPFGRRITLVYGPNSGGKSSIIQALLLMKQSISTVRWHTVLDLIPRGDNVDMGSFEALLHKHDTEREIEIEMAHRFAEIEYAQFVTNLKFTSVERSRATNQSSGSELVAIRYILKSRSEKGYDIRIKRSSDASGVFHWDDEDSIKSYADYIRQEKGSNGTDQDKEEQLAEIFPFMRKMNAMRAMSSDELTSLFRKLQFESHPSGLPSILVEPHDDSSPDDIQSIFEATHIPVAAIPGVLTHLDEMSHVGPHRNPPQRNYERFGRIQLGTTGSNGEFTPHILESDRSIACSTNSWFRKFRIPYSIKIDTQKDPLRGDRIGIDLFDQTGIRLSIADVGFGINQILPIIVEGVIAQNRTICVEQPEIHLHPRLQASIADLLIETSKANENNVGNQWIVETHSELLVRRLQRRIREGEINHMDVSVLYVDPQDDGSSTIQQLELDDDGTFIDEWPKGFFEEGYREIMGY